MTDTIPLEVDEDIEETREKMLFQIWALSLDEKTGYQIAARTDGIRLNKFIHFILKKYIQKDENVLNLLYKYIEERNKLKKNKKQKDKVVFIKEYYSILNEYQKIYNPSEEDLETDIS